MASSRASLKSKKLADFPELLATVCEQGDKREFASLSVNSAQKILWRCEHGHSWYARVSNRARGTGCPICAKATAGKRSAALAIAKSGTLLAKQPLTAAEWHPTRNLPLTCADVAPKSNRLVWWRCKDGHEWQARVADRTAGTGCPLCRARRLGSATPAFEWCPAISHEWDAENNANVDPSQLFASSEADAHWVCSLGHRWVASIASRAIRGSKCPVCRRAARARQDRERSIARSGNLRDRGGIHVELFDSARNEALPESIPVKSGVVAYWKCPNGHEWKRRVSDQVRSLGCPECHRAQLSAVRTAVATTATDHGRPIDVSLRRFNALRKGSLAVRSPSLAAEWHETLNGELRPSDVLVSDNTQIWWKCERCQNEWKAAIRARHDGRTGCPICANNQIGVRIRQASLRRSGTLVDSAPEIAAQWNYAKNGTLTPRDVSPGSGEKVWWLCSRGHEWQAKITDRRKAGCPLCSPKSSQLEIRLYCELRALFGEAKWRHRIGKVECDVFLPNVSVALEVDGAYWHRDNLSRDRKKNEYLQDAGIDLLRVRGRPLPKLRDWDILFSERKFSEMEICKSVASALLLVPRVRVSNAEALSSYIASSSFLAENRYKEIVATLPGCIPEESIVHRFPKVAAEWDREKNEPINPDNVSRGSSLKVWWRCAAGHSWAAVVQNRVGGAGCPHCARRVSSERMVKRGLHRSGSLLAVHPDLAAQWERSEDGSKGPDEVSPNSRMRVWWRCSLGHKWLTPVANRTDGNGCPICREMNRSRSLRRAAIQRLGNLKDKCPEIASEWHPTKNGAYNPSEVSANAALIVWWRCSSGHEWRASVSRRVKGASCPYCGGRYATSENNLSKKFPRVAAEWHPSRNGELRPSDVTPASDKKVWWRCRANHEWQVSVGSRTRSGSGCPYCAGKLVTEDRSLSAVNPDLAETWHPSRNGELRPSDVTPASDKKVWWRCPVGHEWRAVIGSRNAGAGCPECARLARSRPKQAGASLASKYPDLAAQWDRDANASAGPEDLTPGSGVKVWWKCANGHSWQARIKHRAIGSGCPYCARRAT